MFVELSGRLGWLTVGILLLSGCIRTGYREPPADSTVDEAVAPIDLTSDSHDAAPEGMVLATSWILPNTVAWRWQCGESLPAIDHFMLCLAEETTGETSSCLTPNDEPGLGLGECGSGELWHPSISFDLLPSTSYAAQVRALDAAGQLLGQAESSFQTAATPTTRLTVFSEQLPPNASCYLCELSDERAVNGSQSIKAVTKNSAFRFALKQLALTLDGLTATRFEDAYLEFFIEAPTATEIVMTINNADGASGYAPPIGYAAVDGKLGFQRVQIPLTRFTMVDGESFTKERRSHKTLQSVDEIGIGGPDWGKAATIFVDEIAIVY